ncbi:type II and III secretion system protein family protein [Methylonatrum kenyense]|uniref:type II and III secretion system protein family protein n=1 Tax=Methylonatrum kenyense TaxID=455253 RepID=UPI0020BFC9EB|nr:type II and III secretion system protein family protein [Methylonatrum kenyense]MCK8515212.1 type II and III secretion system protein family protein [Methylonatrum kenyense]
MPRLPLGGLALACLMLASVAVEADCDRAENVPRVQEFYAGTQDTLEYPTPIRRIAVGDAEVADVELIEDQELLVTAVSAGATSLMVWTRCSEEPDRLLLLVSQPSALAASGASATDPAQPGPGIPQVQADIRIVEVSRQRLLEAGSRFFAGRRGNRAALGSDGVLSDIGISGSAGPPIGRRTGGFDGRVSPGGGFNFAFSAGGGRTTFVSIINALESSGFASTLAEPSLVTLSGQTATFLAGGEFPVPVQAGVSEAVTIQFKEFGVRLSLTPTVLDENRIVMKVAPEVSELDFTAAVSSGDVEVPALRVRRTDTTVSLGDGESFVISGLISTEITGGMDRLPGLSNIPILGAFFRSSQLDTEDRELVMIVTPRLVQPLRSDAELPPLPGEEYRQYRPGFFRHMFQGLDAIEGSDTGPGFSN